jgi:sugar lactone lactonase YvrE
MPLHSTRLSCRAAACAACLTPTHVPSPWRAAHLYDVVSTPGISVVAVHGSVVYVGIENQVYKVDVDSRNLTNNNLTLVAGVGGPGSWGCPDDGAVAATSSVMGPITAIAFTDPDALYVASESCGVVYKVTGGVLTRFAGGGQRADGGGDGGRAIDAFLPNPQGLAIDSAGNVFISTTSNDGGIRKVSSDGTIATIASSSEFINPQGLAVDRAGDVFIADVFFVK